MVYGSIYESSRMEGSFLPDYAGPDAPFRMVTESLETDQALFDIVIERDFLEAASVSNVQLEATVQALDEGLLGDMWAKIVELLKKIKDKIVSIAKASAVKIGAMFTKDNKALVDKYRKQFDAAQHDKIEIKGYCKAKNNTAADACSLEYLVTRFDTVCSATDKATVDNTLKECTLEKALGVAVGKSASSASSFFKDCKSLVYENEKTVKASDIANDVIETLTNYAAGVKDINELKSICEKGIDKSKETAEEMQKEANRTIDANDEAQRKSKELDQAKANAARAIAQVEQSFCGKFFSVALDLLKFEMKQSRKAFIYIASKGAPSVTKEDADMLTEAEMELQDYVVESAFDQYSYDEAELSA